jgi:hypothetical protein
MVECDRSTMHLDMGKSVAARFPDSIRSSAAMDLDKNHSPCAGISLEQPACTYCSFSLDLYDLSYYLFCHLLSYLLSMEIYPSLVLLRNNDPRAEVL